MLKIFLLLLIGLSSYVNARSLSSGKKSLESVNLLFAEIEMKKEIPIHLFKEVIDHYASEELIKNKNYKNTISILKKLEKLNVNFMKKAFLYKKLSELYEHTGEIAKSITFSEKSIKIIHMSSLKADLNRLELLVNLAGGYRRLKKNDLAEKLFLEVLRYPWFLAESPYVLEMRNMYLSAGRGLISVRRGNLLKLKSINFYPMAYRELLPVLKDAIKEAGGKYEAPSSIFDQTLPKNKTKP